MSDMLSVGYNNYMNSGLSWDAYMDQAAEKMPDSFDAEVAVNAADKTSLADTANANQKEQNENQDCYSL